MHIEKCLHNIINIFFPIIYTVMIDSSSDISIITEHTAKHLGLKIDKKCAQYFEKWHIFKGWKCGCEICDECDHHSHIYCEICKKVANGIYKQCGCNSVR